MILILHFRLIKQYIYEHKPKKKVVKQYSNERLEKCEYIWHVYGFYIVSECLGVTEIQCGKLHLLMV